jgi:pyruvate dehydrogenase E2 component (dihydrolipoyllysine-residue acetyltransferase)
VATPVELPQLGNTVEECIITKWLKREGDEVSSGDMVAEIETDKTTFEITAPVDGTVLATFFEEGALVPVFTNIFVIGEPGESVDAFRPQGSTAAHRAERAPTVEVQRVPTDNVRSAGRFSPRARRFAAEHNFHPAAVSGSGPGGRVLERDLRANYSASSRPSSVPSAASGLRATIARRMRESLVSTAQYTLNASADASGLLALRARIKASRDLPDLTINDLVTFCTIQALVDTPDLNAEFIDGAIVRHTDVHIAFAVDTPRGLMAPVVRHAQTLAVAELARRMKDLGTQAMDGTISPDDLTGATFTISNLGSLGIESFTPVINPPQVAILGVGAIQVRAERRQGTVVFVDSIGLSLTCDHQVIDGAPGARFLQVLGEKIARVESIGKI